MAQSQLPLLTLLLTSELSRRFPTLVLPFEILLPPAKCPEAGKRSDLLSNIGNLLFEV